MPKIQKGVYINVHTQFNNCFMDFAGPALRVIWEFTAALQSVNYRQKPVYHKNIQYKKAHVKKSYCIVTIINKYLQLFAQ